MPEISVCMPCYNAGKYIEECIESVLNQSFPDFEFVIVDDGSTDHTADIVRNYSDSRIRLVEKEHDYIQSLNTSILLAEGKYIARMDSDDVMMPDRLLIQYNYLENHPHIDLIGGGFEYFGNRQGFFSPAINASPITMEEMLENDIIAHPTVMIRKEAFSKIPVMYEEEYKYAEGYKLWMTMLAHGLVLDNIPDILIKYRVSHAQNSLKNSNLKRKITEMIKNEYGKTNDHHTVSE